MDELDRARLRYPLGELVDGRFIGWIRPGVAGMFVDLGAPPQGFVDILTLPRNPGAWPEPGRDARFEVVQHTHGQVRLWPIDAALREPRVDEAMPDRRLERYPVGTVLTATVTQVFVSNRECTIRFGDDFGVVEWSGEPPATGLRCRDSRPVPQHGKDLPHTGQRRR